MCSSASPSSFMTACMIWCLGLQIVDLIYMTFCWDEMPGAVSSQLRLRAIFFVSSIHNLVVHLLSAFALILTIPSSEGLFRAGLDRGDSINPVPCIAE